MTFKKLDLRLLSMVWVFFFYHFLISVSLHRSLDRLTNVLVYFLLKLMCTVDDLKEMGIPLGPRKKIANFVKQKAVKLVKVICALKTETKAHL